MKIGLPSRWLKVAVFVTALMPLVYIFWYVFGSGKIVEPVAFFINQSGIWSMYVLCIGLAVTPLRKLMAWQDLGKLRGMLGLFGFFYVSLHVFLVIWLDHEFDVVKIWRHVIRTPANFMDAIAFLFLVPLALTSNRAAMRRLGGARWKQLHSLVYLIVPLAAARFWAGALTSGRWGETIFFVTLISVLLGVRLYWKMSRD